jgi:opacity protein-like surface antigen
MKKLLSTALAATVCTLAVGLVEPGAAWAQNYDRKGLYVGLGFSYAFQNFGLSKTEQAVSDALGGNTSVALEADDSPGFDIRGGYRFHPNFAIEGEVQYFTAFDLNVRNISAGGQSTKVGSIDTLVMTVNAKGYALTGRIQPYGLLGLGSMLASFDPNAEGVDSEDDRTFAVRFGAGVDCYATENIVVYLEVSYLLPISDYKFGGSDPGLGGDIIPIGVGAQYRF